MENTRELLIAFFNTLPEEQRNTLARVDKPELYEYETEIGKSLVEMNSEEIKELLFRMANNDYALGKVNISYRTYNYLLSTLKRFFDWYIEHIRLIKNPCKDKNLSSSKLAEEFIDTGDLLTPEQIEEAIEKIRMEKVEETADYLEAIIRLFYEGFSNALDFVKCKKKDIDHDRKIAHLDRCDVQLSDRTYHLLMAINFRDKMPFGRSYCDFLSYHDSVFKFPVLKKRLDVFQNLPETDPAGHVTRVLIKDIKPYFNVTVNARTLYARGFYDWLCRKIGAETIKEIVKNNKNYSQTPILMQYAKEYGVIESNISAIKKILLPYTLE